MNLKTKKTLLLISTISALIVTIGCSIAIYTGVLKLETFGDVIPQISYNIQVSILFLCTVINIISIFLISKNVITYKKKLIILNIIQLLFGTIYNLISAIINIFLLSTKTKDVEEEVNVKKELPVLEDITKHKWYVYLIIFIFLFIICYTPFTNLLSIPNNKIATIICLIILYITQITLLVIPMFNELKRDFIVFKNNFKLYLSKILPRFGLIIIAYFICSLFLMTSINTIPVNQAILNSWPIYITAVLAIIVAPITEELMFRGFLKKFIKNDILFIIVSALIFGALHVTSAYNLQQFLFIIPYSILGFAFAQNYVKTKNIASNIFLHSTWNLIGVIAMLLISI